MKINMDLRDYELINFRARSYSNLNRTLVYNCRYNDTIHDLSIVPNCLVPSTEMHKLKQQFFKYTGNNKKHTLSHMSRVDKGYKYPVSRETKIQFLKGDKTMRKFMETQAQKTEDFLVGYISRTVKSRISTDVKLKLDSNTMIDFIKWLKQYDPRYGNRILKISKGNYVFRNNDFFIKIDARTFARIRTGDEIKSSLHELDIINNVNICGTDAYVNIYGKNCFKVANILENLKKVKYTVCYKIATRSSYRGDDVQTEVYYNELNGRSKDTIFLDEAVKNALFAHIDRFMSNEQTYKNRNLLYKTGILLYGEPGTGKSSIANMICTEYSKDMVLINMSEFKNIDIDFVTSTINADDKMYVVVLEDIDCVIGDRESESDVEMQKNINKLLQFLDSSSSPTNVIFIATTNHLEKLDAAITRSGRFDKLLNITNISEGPAINMCKSFGLSEDVAKRIFMDHKDNKTGRINPALLQNLILEELGNKPVELEEGIVEEEDKVD